MRKKGSPTIYILRAGVSFQDYITKERVQQIIAKTEHKIIKRLKLKGIIAKEQFDVIVEIRSKGKSRDNWESKKSSKAQSKFIVPQFSYIPSKYRFR